MSSYKIEEIEGIGPVIGEKLREQGISTTEELLKKCHTKSDRASLAKLSGINEKSILKFANMADLMRIKGIGEEYSELLEASGVDTVPELSHRVPSNLVSKMQEINAERKLTRRVPVLSEVEKWVAQAKELPRALEY
ncbi:MAG: DUF4332 domain-containing protein [Bacteroidales bacterium]